MGPAGPATLVPMGTDVLSLRLDRELLERLRRHAAKRGISVQDYVVRTLVRSDFDERFQSAVEETERFYGATERFCGTPAPRPRSPAE
jgi:Ribbon-helix-helix protein, copG family